MKTIMKIKSMMLTVLAVLAVSMVAVSLTACSDDDDNNKGNQEKFTNTVTVDGKSVTISQVGIAEAFGGEAYRVDIETADGARYMVGIPKDLLDKECDLSKDLTVTTEGDRHIAPAIEIDGIYADVDGSGAFAKGSTMKVVIDGDKLSVTAKGKIKGVKEEDDEVLKAPRREPTAEASEGEEDEVKTEAEFNISYSGTYSKEIDEEEPEIELPEPNVNIVK